MVSALLGLLAVHSFVSGVAARPRCHPAHTPSSTFSLEQPSSTESSFSESSTTISDIVSSSASVELSTSTESEDVASSTDISESTLTISTSTESESVASSTVINSESSLTSESFESIPSSTASSSEPTLTVPTSFSSESVMPSSTESSTLASSTVFIPTSTAPHCDPTPTYLPEYCLASMPSQCNSLNRTPTLSGFAATLSANACRNVFTANGALSTAIAQAGCFASIGQPGAQFNPTSAYSCVSAAPIYCQSTTALCDPFATPTPLPINGGFEPGDLSSWVNTEFVTGSPANNVQVSVSSEQSHSDGKSLKVTTLGLDYGAFRSQQDVKLVPGARYELSYWWYTTNNVAGRGTSVGITMLASSVHIQQNPFEIGRPANQWYRASQTFVAATSFGNVYFSVSSNGNQGTTSTFYIDDIGLTLV